MKKQKRLLFVILFVFVFSIMFSISFIACESNHECTGDCCRTCAVLSVCEDVLNVITTSALSAVFVIIMKLSVTKLSDCLYNILIKSTPVVSKVKLLN